jgi:flagellum-specific peptidoglycan hydrolase FlgJ
MPLSQTQLTSLIAAAAAAVFCERDCGLPAELTVAQWADESGWGKHQPGNNCFGIKAKRGQTLQTTEYRHGSETPNTEIDTFEVFPDLEACFDRHAELITTCRPYAPAWSQFLKDKKLGPFIERVAKSYATDPNYALKLKKILVMPEVVNAIRDARRPLVNIAPAT